MTSVDMEKKLLIEQPIEQAGQCLETWLAEEKLSLSEDKKSRLTALLALYFHEEGEGDTELMLNFLRHYSEWRERDVDMDNITEVIYEIRELLGQAEGGKGKKTSIVLQIFGGLFLLCLFALGGVFIFNPSIITPKPPVAVVQKDLAATRMQQEELKDLVHKVATKEGVTIQSIWVGVKTPLSLKSYRDMTQKQFKKTRKDLLLRLQD